MPHKQNTSGFFITILEKYADINYEERVPAEGELKTYESPLTIQEMKDGRLFEFHRVERKDPDIEYIAAYYGLSNDFPYR